jgi:hypothetical protein
MEYHYCGYHHYMNYTKIELFKRGLRCQNPPAPPLHDIIKTLSRASPRHGSHRRRRSERRHIWAAVHCADGSAVRPSAQMQPVPSAPSKALGKGIDQGLPQLTGLCLEPAGAVGRAHVCADGPPSTQAPLPRAPPGSRQRSNFFGFWVEIFSLLKVH